MSSLEDFEAGVSEVRLLLEVASATPPGESKSAIGNAVYRACVVLLVSHFESYLKSIAENFSDTIGDGRLESRQIPRGIRELHTLPRLGEIMECNNNEQRSVLLKKLQPLMALWNDSAKPPSGIINSAVLARTVSNADDQTIDDLFQLMGSSSKVCDGDLDIFEDSDTVSVNIRFGLADAVKCRNDISHGDLSRRPTEEDVRRYIAFLKGLAQRLDRKASALIELVSS
jgi:HEPN superfamily RiboL-PSP-like protein